MTCQIVTERKLNKLRVLSTLFAEKSLLRDFSGSGWKHCCRQGEGEEFLNRDISPSVGHLANLPQRFRILSTTAQGSVCWIRV